MWRKVLLTCGFILIGGSAYAFFLEQQYDFSGAGSGEYQRVFTNSTGSGVSKQFDTATTTGGPVYLVFGPCSNYIPKWNDDGYVEIPTPTDSRQLVVPANKCAYLVERGTNGGKGTEEVH